MAKTNFDIKPIDRNNCGLLVPLMKDCFGMDVTPQYFEWKYFDNPVGNCIGFVAIDSTTGTAVAFYGAIPQLYIVNGISTRIYQACDTMTHTSQRKKSLFPVLARECYNYLQDNNHFLMIGIGGTPQSFPVLEHFGWKTVFYFRIYFKLSIFCQAYFLQRYHLTDFSESITDDELEKLISAQPRTSKIHSPRNLQHYKWRISNPNFQYKIVTYKSEGVVVGMVVFYIQNNKIFLFDFIFTVPGARKALGWFLSRLVVKNKYKGIIAFCQDQGYQSDELKKMGFVYNPFNKGPLSVKSPFLVYTDESRMPAFTKPEAWAMTGYDYDAS